MATISCRGYNGTVEFDGTFVTIQRKGVLGRMSVGKGEKRIPLSQIVAVQWKEPGPLVNGFISFTITGASENKRGFGKQTHAAVRDENAVVVTRAHAQEFQQLRSTIEGAIASREMGANSPGPASSMADELAKLAQLREAGVLTEDEFRAQKARLLG